MRCLTFMQPIRRPATKRMECVYQSKVGDRRRPSEVHWTALCVYVFMWCKKTQKQCWVCAAISYWFQSCRLEQYALVSALLQHPCIELNFLCITRSWVMSGGVCEQSTYNLYYAHCARWSPECMCVCANISEHNIKKRAIACAFVSAACISPSALCTFSACMLWLWAPATCKVSAEFQPRVTVYCITHTHARRAISSAKTKGSIIKRKKYILKLNDTNLIFGYSKSNLTRPWGFAF